MHIDRSQFVAAYPPPSWQAQLSLPANLTTAMIQLDYALHDGATPTGWATTFLKQLPPNFATTLELVRAVLAHGVVLREFVLDHLPVTAPAHHDWSALYRWLTKLSASEMAVLIDHGILSGLTYYHEQMQPMQTVDHWLSQLVSPLPTVPPLDDPQVRHIAMQALLASWQLPDMTPALAFLDEPQRLQTAIAQLWQQLWVSGWDKLWAQHQSALSHQVAILNAQSQVSSPASGVERVRAVTGLQVTGIESELLHKAAQLIFVPCLNLGQFMALLPSQKITYVLYEPSFSAEVGAQTDTVAEQLAAFGPALSVLGDETRLKVVLLLAQKGDLVAQQIVEAVGVHQSTVSRVLAQLEQGGIVQMQRQGKQRRYNLNVAQLRSIGRFLLKVTENTIGEGKPDSNLQSNHDNHTH